MGKILHYNPIYIHMNVYTGIAELMYVVDFQNSVYAMATDTICAIL